MANNEDGVWRTIGGRRVFIRNGQSLSDAMIQSGKFKNLRSDYRKAKEEENKPKRLEDELLEQTYKKSLEEAEKRGMSYKEYVDQKAKEGVEKQGGLKPIDPNNAKDEASKILSNEEQDRIEKYSGVSFSADKQDILDRFSADYGYDENKSRLENLRGQIDYMRNPNETINQTAQRLVEGGDFLIYNEDVKEYLKDRGIKFNDDNFFDVYKKEMADNIEQIYNTKEPKEFKSGNPMSYEEYSKKINEITSSPSYKEKMDKAVNELNEKYGYNKVETYPRAEGGTKFKDLGLEVSDEKAFSDYLRDKYGTDDFRIINYDNKDGAKKIYNEYLKQETINKENKKYPDYANKGYGVKYYSVEDAIKDPNSAMNNYIRNKAYKNYMKQHPNSKMTLDDFLKKKK